MGEGVKGTASATLPTFKPGTIVDNMNNAGRTVNQTASAKNQPQFVPDAAAAPAKATVGSSEDLQAKVNDAINPTTVKTPPIASAEPTLMKDATDFSSLDTSKIDPKFTGLKNALTEAEKRLKENLASGQIAQPTPGVNVSSVQKPPEAVVSKQQVETVTTGSAAVTEPVDMSQKAEDTKIELVSPVINDLPVPPGNVDLESDKTPETAKEIYDEYQKKLDDEKIPYAEYEDLIVMPETIPDKDDPRKPILIAFHKEHGSLKIIIPWFSKNSITGAIKDRINTASEKNVKLGAVNKDYSRGEGWNKDWKEGIYTNSSKELSFVLYDGASLRDFDAEKIPQDDPDIINQAINANKPAVKPESAMSQV